MPNKPTTSSRRKFLAMLGVGGAAAATARLKRPVGAVTVLAFRVSSMMASPGD